MVCTLAELGLHTLPQGGSLPNTNLPLQVIRVFFKQWQLTPLYLRFNDPASLLGR
jgi:hypothetical protein